MSIVKVFKRHKDAKLPVRKGTENAGYDICTCEDFTMYPNEFRIVNTGLVIQPPPGYHTEILVRSSMAAKHQIILVNSIGLIDRSYSGPDDELKLILFRLERDDVHAYNGPLSFEKGERIGQLVFRKTELLEIEEVAEAPGVNRGGLGSTGKK